MMGGDAEVQGVGRCQKKHFTIQEDPACSTTEFLSANGAVLTTRLFLEGACCKQ